MQPLSISSVSKTYGAHAALRDVSFNVGQGELFGLIGLNGAGKTTLIKILLDLTRANSGEARIFDKPHTEPTSRKRLVYLPEKFQPSRYVTGEEYLRLSLTAFGLEYNRDEACAMAEALDLNPDVLSRRVGNYSKGMGQKLGLAGALLARRDLIMLDEPMSGLDPKARIFLKRQFLNTHKEGKTIFFSSHILADIDELCTRISVIHEGVLLFIGTPSAFKQTYGGGTLENAFLAAIGTNIAA